MKTSNENQKDVRLSFSFSVHKVVENICLTIIICAVIRACFGG